MEILTFIQKCFVLLLPGIVGRFIYKAISIKKEQHYYFEFITIICFSCISFQLVDWLFMLTNAVFPCFIWKPTNILYQLANGSISIPAANVSASIICAIALSLISIKAAHENWLFKWFFTESSGKKEKARN